MLKRETRNERAPRTPAQWYCLLAGAVLLLAGIFGFVADGSFDTGGNAQGDNFLGFEVNGWHNLVHLVSGIVLLAAANTRPTAKTVAIGFGFVYAIVALWGLIDGNDVLGVVPVNGADNILHVLLAGAGIAAGMASATTKRQQLRKRHGGDQRSVEERLPASPSAETRRPSDAPTSGGGPTGVGAPAPNYGEPTEAGELPAGPGRAETRGDAGGGRFAREDPLADDPEQRFRGR